MQGQPTLTQTNDDALRRWRDVVLPRVRKLSGKLSLYVILIIMSAFVLLPVFWMLTVALKPDNVPVFTIPPQWFPSEYWEWQNFSTALLDPVRPFLRFTFNTLFIFAINVVGMLFSCTLVGFAFARLRFRGSGFLFNVLIITMLMPWQAQMIPQFLMFHKLGWYGTYLPLTVPSFTGSAFFIFMVRQYMRTFPRELDDAAKIDGCGYFGIFWHIILPLCKPVLAVVIVFMFLGAWGDLLGPLIYLNSTDQFTIAIGLANFATRADPNTNLLMAANLIMMIPPIIVYFFAQEQLIGGIASVGLKG
jgi:ABC-type glycerol-3-phosphate transport system permease component